MMERIHGFTWADQDWIALMDFKILWIRAGSDSIYTDRIGFGQKNFTVHSFLTPITSGLWSGPEVTRVTFLDSDSAPVPKFFNPVSSENF